jgi:hypothetical protein
MINIKEKDGKIIFNDTQEFNQDNLLVKYRNDEMTKKLLESQLYNEKISRKNWKLYN